MVYAKAGRTGVYQFQKLLGLLNEDIKERNEELENTSAVLNSFDKDNLRNRLDWKLSSKASDPPFALTGRRTEEWDIEIYDRLCHKQDKPFSTPDLYIWLYNAGLHFVSNNHLLDKHRLSIENLEILGLDRKLVNKLKYLSTEEQHTIAELVDGGIINHNIYVSKKPKSKATLEDENMVPYFYGVNGSNVIESFRYALKNPGIEDKLLNVETFWRVRSDNKFQHKWPLTLGVLQFLTNVVVHEETLTYSEILDKMENDLKIDRKKVAVEVKRFFEATSITDMFLFRKKGVAREKLTARLDLFGITVPNLPNPQGME